MSAEQSLAQCLQLRCAEFAGATESGCCGNVDSYERKRGRSARDPYGNFRGTLHA